MKKYLKKQDCYYFIGVFILLLIVHFPLLSNHILSADILLNNQFYRGYAWEISLGRFGLYIIGLLKSFLSFPHIDLFLSFFLIIFILYFLFDLFEIKDLWKKILIGILVCISPFTSATLTFHYCSIAYLLSFLCGLLSVYSYNKISHKILKWIIPILCIVISLSMYQAYLSLIVTIYVFYQIHLLLSKKINFKKTLLYLLPLFGGVLLYFIGMKLSLLVFHIDMASYSNANEIGLSTLLSFPHKFVDCYRLFFEYFFTNDIMKNTFLYNHIFHGIILLLFMIQIIYQAIQKKIDKMSWIFLILGILLLPVFMNCVIFVISDAKLQLLMSAAYLILPIYFISSLDKKVFKIFVLITLVFLFRNYLIQDQASYLSLENTYMKYHTVIESAIITHINDQDTPYAIIGSMKDKNTIDSSKLHQYTYGYICDYDLFWNEYGLRKLGFERFVYEEFGLKVSFVDEDTYQSLLESTHDELIYEEDGVIVINFSNYK